MLSSWVHMIVREADGMGDETTVLDWSALLAMFSNWMVLRHSISKIFMIFDMFIIMVIFCSMVVYAHVPRTSMHGTPQTPHV
jgi:hypothetical protein